MRKTAKHKERVCHTCFKDYQPSASSQKHCHTCRPAVRRGYYRHRYRKHRDTILKAADPYRKSPKAKRMRVQASLRSQAKYPLKQLARTAVKRAIKSGVLSRPDTCDHCGGSATRIEGHHPDYSKPLKVLWLCRPCHNIIHGRSVLIPQHAN